MGYNYPRWSKLPYTGENSPPNNPEEPLAGSWPLIFLKRDGRGWFTDPLGNPIPNVKDPNTIDWHSQLRAVQETLSHLTVEEQVIADYWGTGQAIKQITPIIDGLIDTYTVFMTGIPPESLSQPRASRILALTQAAIQDATIVCWAVKYRFDVARPNQQDHNLPTYLCTPRHPSYVSGHGVIAGVAAEVLSYFFPAERDRLNELADEDGISRVYAGVHFPIDISEGLKLGRAIGRGLVDYFRTQVDAVGNPVDQPFTDNRNPKLPPGCYPYEQAIPFDFEVACQSTILKVSITDKIKKFLLRLAACKRIWTTKTSCNCSEE
ncbi:phosphatase PAP2 family protein [Neobacillus drentensis]|uniref:phosphatase PAP2 family protein n=1 Tax=Neobacillus drentensis TaxID=220684 RepID=UPI0030001307